MTEMETNNMDGDKQIIANIAIKENYQQLKRDRKRKQINNISKSSKRNRNSSIHVLFSYNAEGVIKMECDSLSSTLQQLPMVILSQILSNLNITDQKHFADTCRATRMALKIYWDKYTDLHIDTLMEQTFPFITKNNRYSLHAIRREIALILHLIPNFTLRKLYLQPFYSLHIQDLREIEMRTKKSARQLFGALEHLDLRGCAVEYAELRYFSNACTRLSSIALTHAAVFLPNEIFVNDNLLKKHHLKDPFGIIRNFLRISLPNFTEMEKRGMLPVEHIELLFKLLILFPYLHTFQID